MKNTAKPTYDHSFLNKFTTLSQEKKAKNLDCWLPLQQLQKLYSEKQVHVSKQIMRI